MWSRREVVLGAAGITAGVVAGAQFPSLARAGEAGTSTARSFRFASSPDTFNADLGDISGLPTYDGGQNSINNAWRRAIDTCFGAVAAHDPQALFVAGDLVEGRWNIDSFNRRIFGETSSEPTTRGIRLAERSITRAGRVYYGFYQELMAHYGFDLYAAVGDHELLDDRHGPVDKRWKPGGNTHAAPDNRYFLVDHCKQVWADHFTSTAKGAPRFERRPEGSTRRTAYATSFADVLTLITVDVFSKHPGGVRMGVYGKQLAWLREEIKHAKERGHIVIVQGHVPILKPYRLFNSGNLHVVAGDRSDFYRTMDECGVDFYFCGEVHDVTVQQQRPGSPVQVSHGCVFGSGFNYLIGDVRSDGVVDLTLYEVPQVLGTRDRRIWQTDFHNTQRTVIVYGQPQVRGRLTYADGRILERTEKLGPYHPVNDPYDNESHKTTVYL